MNDQEKVLQVYKQAKVNLGTDDPCHVDEVIVALFETVKKQQKQLAELTLKVSLLEDHEGMGISEDVFDVIAKAKQVH